MPKIYRRTENGTETLISVSDALGEVNDAMMGGSYKVETMSSSHGNHRIEYTDGRKVSLVEIEGTVPAKVETEQPDVNVISYNGGKVHTGMFGEEDPYPLCRGGGMNQMLTKFCTTTAPLTCKTCLTYAERRAQRLAEMDA